MDAVSLVIISTKDQTFGGQELKAGQEVITHTDLPRQFAELAIKHCSPGFRMEIR